MNKIKHYKSVRITLFSLLVTASYVVIAVASPLHLLAQTASSPLTIPTDPEQTTTIEQRLAQRKLALKLSLNATSQQRLAVSCGLAQTAIGIIKTKDTGTRNVRTQIYTDAATKLNNIVQNLGNQGFDASDLSSAQTKFNAAINKYLMEVQDYKTTMDDLVTMDCTKDATGFEASLITARNLRASLANDSTNIKTNYSQVLKALNTTKDEINKEGGR